MNKFECSELRSTLQSLTHLVELVVSPFENRELGKKELDFLLSYLRTKSCVLVQILQTCGSMWIMWKCFVDLYLKVRLFFSLWLSATSETLIEFVTCKNNNMRIRYNTQCDCWIQKEFLVSTENWNMDSNHQWTECCLSNLRPQFSKFPQ